MKVIATDSFFTKGFSHEVCEDYALHGDNYIVVCDGCSSSPMSDVGARLVALAIIQIIETHASRLNGMDHFLTALQVKLQNLKDQYSSFPQTMFDTTFLVAFKIDNMITIMGRGDGEIILHDTLDKWRHYHLSYASNAPYYLSYDLDKDRESIYRDKFGSGGVDIQVSDLTIGEEKDRYTRVSFKLSSNEYSFSAIDKIILSSDGAGSFVTPKDSEFGIPIHTVLQNVADFKNLTGSFLKRRMHRVVKENKSQGFDHYDDLGVAAMILEYGENDE